MNSAFSDYVVPISLSQQQFEDFCRQRGLSRAHSRMVHVEGDIAAFWLASAPSQALAGGSYTLSTGTTPDHRRKGLLKQLFQQVSEAARLSGASRMQHEVITTNLSAVSAYEHLGFRPARELAIWKVPAREVERQVCLDTVEYRRIAPEALPEDLKSFFDTDPTPQNALGAIRNLIDTVVLIGAYKDTALIGWSAAYADGAVAQLAVRKDWRRKGIGSTLLSRARQSVNTDLLTFVNVDTCCETAQAFLRAHGGEDVLRQYDMRFDF